MVLIASETLISQRDSSLIFLNLLDKHRLCVKLRVSICEIW